MTLIQEILDIQVPTSVKISPNADKVLFATSTSFQQRIEGVVRQTSTIWVAERDAPGSARKLTSGDFNDHSPQWLPDGSSIIFISDRAKVGERSALYIMPFTQGGEAYAITPTENARAIDMFCLSSKGDWVAYLSADEKSEREKQREEEKDDAQVWGENWTLNRLRLVNLTTRTVLALSNELNHLKDLAWSDDGKMIAFAETKTSNIVSSSLYGMTVGLVELESKQVTRLCRFPLQLYSLTWSGNDLYFIGAFSKSMTSSNAVYRIHDVALYTGKQEKDEAIPHVVAHGVDDCAASLIKVNGEVIVFVRHGMEDQLRIMNGRKLFARKKEILAADAVVLSESGSTVLAVVQGDVNHPPELFTKSLPGGDLVRLTRLGEVCEDKQFGSCTFVTCPSLDGKVQLECPLLLPASAQLEPDGKPSGPLPTVVLVHGGPYYRVSDAFNSSFFHWSPLLLRAGYAVLLPEYRGSSGRGDEFARYANGTGGIYEDVVAMTEHVVQAGYANKDRLVVAGWSQGGYMSYLSSVRNGAHGLGWEFKASIPGAGISDQDTMCFTSDFGSTFQADLARGAPWTLPRNDIATRQNSAIWEFADALSAGIKIPPMLILHGEKDERVPLEQGVAMQRAMETAGLPHQLVVYPREPHIFTEATHVADMAERVLNWVVKHIGDERES